MLLLKVISVLGIGAGLGVPVASTLKGFVSNSAEAVLRTSDSVVKIEWMGKDMKKEVGEIFNGFGEIIHKDQNQGRKAEVIGIKLQTWGTFKDDVCQNMGFSEGEENKSGLGCHQGQKD